MLAFISRILQGSGQAQTTATINQLLAKVNTMPTMADFQAAQATHDQKVEALITAFNNLQANVKTLTDQLAAATAANDPNAIQAAIDDFTKENGNIDAALGNVVPAQPAAVDPAQPA